MHCCVICILHATLSCDEGITATDTTTRCYHAYFILVIYFDKYSYSNRNKYVPLAPSRGSMAWNFS
jgi:hypothetical protein